MEGVFISLATFVETDNSREVEFVYTAGLLQRGIAQTETDDQGVFLFDDIRAGDYELFILSQDLRDVRGDYVSCEVASGQVLDLGTFLFVNAGDGRYQSRYAGPTAKTSIRLWVGPAVMAAGALLIMLAYLAYRVRAPSSAVRIDDL